MSAISPVVDSPILAHRGASAFAPENTLRAIEVAAERGATWIETDVRLTVDGHLVMIHDETLDRTTNGSGFVSEYTLEHIKALDAGSWFGAEFAGLRVPTLKEYLLCILRLGLSLQLELKPMRGREEELAQAVVKVLKKEWAFDNPDSKLFVASSAERSLSILAKHLPDVPRALALHYLPREPERLAAEVGVQILHVKDNFITTEALERIAGAPIEIAVATVNNPDRARFLIDNGVQSVITDNPGLLLAETAGALQQGDDLSDLVAFEEIMKEAAAIASERFHDRAGLGTRLKSARDLVTDADIEIEQLLRRRLSQRFEVEGFVGEEGGGQRSQTYWCVDPIDGTANFAAGLPYWGLSAALIQDGASELAVICLPVQKTILSAKAGCGAFRNGRRLSMQKPTGVPTVAVGDSRSWDVAAVRAVEDDLYAAGYDVVKYRSSIASLGGVILGLLDGYCECFTNLWDVAAGALIAREAGLSCDVLVEPQGTTASIVCGPPDLCARLRGHIPIDQRDDAL